MPQLRTRLLAALGALAAIAAHAPPGAAQCDPQVQVCDNSPPLITITPGTSTVTSSVSVTVKWTDFEGLSGSTRRIVVNGQQVTWPYTLNSTGTSATSTGTVYVSAGTPSVLEASITDRGGLQATRTATYTLQEYRQPPDVSLAPFHTEFHDAAMGGASLAFSTPAYRSLDQDRALTLAYHSGQAAPFAFVQVDARDPSPWDPNHRAQAMSLQVLDVETGLAVQLQNGQRELFFENHHPTMRLAAQWDVRSRATGDYRYEVVVRSYWNDAGTVTFKETRTPVRILVVNEVNSPFGAGWSMPGLERIRLGRYPHATLGGQQEGAMVTGGDGTAWFFPLASCTAGRCTYASPAGDLTTLVRESTGAWTRTMRDGSRAEYDTWGNLVRTVDPFGSASRIDWALRGGVWVPTLFTDPAGKATEVLFQSGGCGCWVAGFRDPGGRVTSLTHGVFSTTIQRLNTVTHPDGSRPLSSITYSGAHYLQGWVDGRNAAWNVGYDRGYGTSVTAPYVSVGGVATRPVTLRQAPQFAALRFDTATSLARVAHAPPPDSVLAYQRDPAGHKVTMTFDRFWNVTRVNLPAGGGSTRRYDTGGRLVYESSDEGGVTTYTYNTAGDLTAQEVNGSTVFRAFYGTRPGLPDSTLSSGVRTHYRYGAAGQVLSTWTGSRADSASRATRYTYDARGRVTTVTTADGLQSATGYAPDGWMNTTVEQAYRRVGEAVEWSTTYYDHDAYGRVWARQSPDGWSGWYKDLLNRDTTVISPNGAATRFAYAGPDLVRLTDGAGKVFGWTRDALGRVTRETFPDSLSRTYAYSVDGLPVSRTDRRGLTVGTSYDANHRVKTITPAESGATPITFAYQTYFPAVVASTGVGSDTLTLVRDDGLLLERSRRVAVLGGRRYVAEYLRTYNNPLSRTTRLQGWSGGTLAWEASTHATTEADRADPAELARHEVVGFDGATTTLTLNGAGRLLRIAYPGGTTASFGYNQNEQPWRTSFNRSGLQAALARDFAYDAMGRIASRTRAAGDTSWTYGYDAMGQVSQHQVLQRTVIPSACDPTLEECPPRVQTTVLGSTTFGYDAVGNRTDSGAQLEPRSNRYATFDGWNLYYDAEGNLTRKWKPGVADHSYVWNSLGQLARTETVNGPNLGYEYNGFGQRIRRIDLRTGTATGYVYGLDGNLLLEVDGAGTPLRSYTHAGTDQPLSVTMGVPGPGAPTYYYANEHPGHVVGLFDAAGGLVGRYRYTPFGAAAAGSAASVSQPLRFMGRELDDGSGLYYVRARWYDPHLGRFISEDPIGLAGGINTYAYAFNDPVNRRDPSGLFAGCPPGTTRLADGSCQLNHGYRMSPVTPTNTCGSDEGCWWIRNRMNLPEPGSRTTASEWRGPPRRDDGPRFRPRTPGSMRREEEARACTATGFGEAFAEGAVEGFVWGAGITAGLTIYGAAGGATGGTLLVPVAGTAAGGVTGGAIGFSMGVLTTVGLTLGDGFKAVAVRGFECLTSFGLSVGP